MRVGRFCDIVTRGREGRKIGGRAIGHRMPTRRRLSAGMGYYRESPSERLWRACGYTVGIAW